MFYTAISKDELVFFSAISNDGFFFLQPFQRTDKFYTAISKDG